MREILQTMFDPAYWLTVVPAGTTMLGYCWYRDSKI